MKVEKQWCKMAESWCSCDQSNCGILYPLELHDVYSGGHALDCYKKPFSRMKKHELRIRRLDNRNISNSAYVIKIIES